MNWQGKRVLVTGAGGFIGSHLAEKLVDCGATVRAFVHYNALGSWGWLDQSHHKDDIEVMAGDISDYGSVLNATQSIDMVFHLAALIAIPYSYVAPNSYVQTNIIGTLNVLQAARALGTQRIIHTSTSETYGTARYVPIDENHPLQGQSPYSASKIGADKIVESFYLSFNVPVVTVRPFNTFGPRQSARAVIPTIITQALSGQSIKLGSVSPTRDLNYVANTTDGFIKAAEAENVAGSIFNIGSGREISVGDLAQLIGKLVGKELIIETDPHRLRPTKSEVERLLADNRQARALLRWEPTVSLEEGLQATIEWMQAHLERYRLGVYVI